MEKILLARSSDGKSSYSVTFLFENGRLVVLCDCSAGNFGKLCKHKLSLLRGDEKMLFSLGQEGLLQEVQEWVKKSGYAELLLQIRKAESDLEDAQKQLAGLNRKIELLMKG